MTTHRRKGRRLLQAATPTTKDRAVAQLEPNPTPRLKALGGGEADSWNKRIGQTLGGALPDSHLPNFVEQPERHWRSIISSRTARLAQASARPP